MLDVIRHLPTGEVPEPERAYSLDGKRIPPLDHVPYLWASLTEDSSHPPPADSPVIRVVLDTGFNGTFLISEVAIRTAMGDAFTNRALSEENRDFAADIRTGGIELAAYCLFVWIWPNRPNQREANRDLRPVEIELPSGVPVIRTGQPINKPPLLGLQAINFAGWHLTISGEGKYLTLAAPALIA